MARPQKLLTSKITLRMSNRERAIVAATQDYFRRSGVRLSQNDVIRHLILVGSMPPILTQDEARRRIERHWTTCTVCTADENPKCAMGVSLRDAWHRFSPPPPPPPPPPMAPVLDEAAHLMRTREESPAGPPRVDPRGAIGIGPFGPTFFPTNPPRSDP